MDTLKQWAQGIKFPAFVHCYGPERTHRNAGGYGCSLCLTPDDVVALVDGVGFDMPLAEIEVSATYVARGLLTNQRFARGFGQGVTVVPIFLGGGS